MAKGNNKGWVITGILLTAILGGLGWERNSTWVSLAQLQEKKVEKAQYEKDQEAWQKKLDEAIIRIEKSGLSAEARAEKLRETMDRLLIELRGPTR